MIIDKNHELISEIYKSIDSKNISAEELLAHLEKRKELQNWYSVKRYTCPSQ